MDVRRKSKTWSITPWVELSVVLLGFISEPFWRMWVNGKRLLLNSIQLVLMWIHSDTEHRPEERQRDEEKHTGEKNGDITGSQQVCSAFWDITSLKSHFLFWDRISQERNILRKWKHCDDMISYKNVFII